MIFYILSSGEAFKVHIQCAGGIEKAKKILISWFIKATVYTIIHKYYKTYFDAKSTMILRIGKLLVLMKESEPNPNSLY